MTDHDSIHTPTPGWLTESPGLGDEISVTARWTPTRPRRRRHAHGPSTSTDVFSIWTEAQRAASADPDVLSTDVHRVVGDDSVLVHQVFRDADALARHLGGAAVEQRRSLAEIAEPGVHMVRGLEISDDVRSTIETAGVPVATGEWTYGFARDDGPSGLPDTAVQVTAVWTVGDARDLDELRHWWREVATLAHEIEPGMLRFEAHEVADRPALIIHETFADTAELKFHLTKGTAAKFKKNLDRIAAPEAYYFRGSVAWSIRTYSKFMRLPATYTR